MADIAPITLADVARTAGVSLTTASHALRGKHRVSGETIQRVRAAADRLGYQGNPSARALAGGFNERSIAMVTLDLDLGVLVERLARIQGKLRGHGYQTTVHVLEGIAEQTAVMGTICDQRPRALLGDFGGPIRLAPATVEILHRYQASGGILIAYSDRTAIQCDHVTLDRVEASYRAARCLIAAGHRRLGIRYHDTVSPERQAGFLKGVAEAGLSPESVWQHTGGQYEEGGARLATDFLALPPEKRPTGLYVINDVSAGAFIASLYRAGLRVPEAVSIVGNDNSPAARFGLVPLTTVDAGIEQIVEGTVNRLLARISGQVSGPPEYFKVVPDLIERESVSPPLS